MMRGTDQIVDGRYVYWAWRAWDATRPTLGAICLRPYRDERSAIRTLCHYADAHGYGSLSLCNLFGMSAGRGKVWRVYIDPVGPRNDDVLFEKLAGLRVLECWGSGGSYRGRAGSLRSDPRYAALDVFRFGTGPKGCPAHPFSLLLESRLRRFV